MAAKVVNPQTPGSRGLAAFTAKMGGDKGRYKGKIGNGPPAVIVPTGSVMWDWMLRVGGLQLGRVYEILGPKDAGKSTFALHAIIEHLRMFPDRGGCYINMENTFDPVRAMLMGLDCSDEAIASGRWAPLMPEHSEDVSDMARDYCGSGVYSIVVVDSIGAMESDRVLTKDAEKAADNVGRNAKIITQMTKALSTMARLNNCTVLLVNQPRANIGGMAGAPDVSAGPKAMQHSTTAKIEMRPASTEAEERRMLKLPGEADAIEVSIKTRAKVSRMKNGLPGRVAETFINRVATQPWGPPGVDAADGYMTIGARQGIIRQGGAWYTFPDGHRENGRPAALRYLRAKPEAQQAIREQVRFEAPTDVLPEQEEAAQEGDE